MARIVVQGKLVDTSRNNSHCDHLHKTAKKKSSSNCLQKMAGRRSTSKSNCDSGPIHSKSRKGHQLNKWSEVHMKEAIAEFQQGERSLREIARAWQVPKTI